jgi:hypothetical protein
MKETSDKLAFVSGSLPTKKGKYVIWSDNLCKKVEMKKDRWGYYWIDLIHKCRPEDEVNFGCVFIGDNR